MNEATTWQKPIAGASPGRFPAVALAGLAALGPAPAGGGTLALELGLSAWMRMAGVPLSEARSGLAALRGAILEAGGLDRASEPIPLFGRDPKADTLTLAAYLSELLVRAARASGTDPATIAERVTARLSA